MKVTAVYDAPSERYLIYVEIGRQDDSRWMSVPNAPPVLVAPGEEAPIYLLVRQDIAEAIVEAIEPNREFSSRFLDDTLVIRDRLLKLVEAIVEGE